MIRHALRALRRSPAFTLTVVVTLALGIGANAVMFGIVDRLMFRPLGHLRDPAQVHRVYWQWQDQGREVTSMSTQYARYLDIRRWTTSFSQVAAFSERDLAVGEGESARELRIGTVSASYFDFFDARPALGRFFTAAEDQVPRGADVVVLAHGFWQAEFGGENVLGRRLRIGNVDATIVGVAPRGFDGVNDATPPVAYLPITTYAASTGTEDARTYFSAYRWGWVHVLVRQRPGVSPDAARADATRAFQQSWTAAAADNPRNPAVDLARPAAILTSVRPGASPTASLEARTALWLMIVAGLVLVIAASNVANLVLARALRRQRETAVQLALGVSRRRLVLQAATETLILAGLGGAAALLVAQTAGAAIRRLLITGTAEIAVWTDPRTVVVTGLLALVVGVTLGIVPALIGQRGDLATALRSGGRGVTAGGGRLRAGLLITQGALAVLMLIGAALFVRSLDAVRRLPMGYDPEQVLIVNRVIRGDRPPEATVQAMRTTLLATASALPEVESAAWISSAPFYSTSNTDLFVAGVDSVGRLGRFTYQATTPGYFRTMGTRILRGRGLEDADRLGAPDVAVVSESMARVLWPGQDPIGQCMRVRLESAPCTTVVGVAEDMIQQDLLGAERYHFYLAIEQYTRTSGWGMALRVRGDPAAQALAITRQLQAVLPGGVYVTVQRLGQIVDRERRSWRLGAVLFLAFGALALVVAAIGLYGVIGYRVAERTHELGIRVALGAPRGSILRLVTGESLRLVLWGAAIGAVLAALAAGWIQPLLFQQSARDPGIYGVVTGIMLFVALLASAGPAWRAARSDPNQALRAE